MKINRSACVCFSLSLQAWVDIMKFDTTARYSCRWSILTWVITKNVETSVTTQTSSWLAALEPCIKVASSPGYSQILSHSRGEKSGEGLVPILRHGPEMVDSILTLCRLNFIMMATWPRNIRPVQQAIEQSSLSRHFANSYGLCKHQVANEGYVDVSGRHYVYVYIDWRKEQAEGKRVAPCLSSYPSGLQLHAVSFSFTFHCIVWTQWVNAWVE